MLLIYMLYYIYMLYIYMLYIYICYIYIYVICICICYIEFTLVGDHSFHGHFPCTFLPQPAKTLGSTCPRGRWGHWPPCWKKIPWRWRCVQRRGFLRRDFGANRCICSHYHYTLRTVTTYAIYVYYIYTLCVRIVLPWICITSIYIHEWNAWKCHHTS